MLVNIYLKILSTLKLSCLAESCNEVSDSKDTSIVSVAELRDALKEVPVLLYL